MTTRTQASHKNTDYESRVNLVGHFANRAVIVEEPRVYGARHAIGKAFAVHTSSSSWRSGALNARCAGPRGVYCLAEIRSCLCVMSSHQAMFKHEFSDAKRPRHRLTGR